MANVAGVDPEFVTVKEIADRLRVSKMTVYRLVSCGELPSVRFGRSVRIPRQAVVDYMQAHLGGVWVDG